MKHKVLIALLPEYISVLLLVLLIAVLGNCVVDVYIENAPIPDRTTVIIDAGHGGIDGGATSCTGILESQINLEIALRLNDLMHFIGINTVMIRTTDRSVYTEGETISTQKVSDLKHRVNIINNTENALLVSIHQNYFGDSRYSGAQVFYAKTQDSDVLAKSLQNTFIAKLNKGSRREAKKASGIYLMEHIRCTGVLVECGFLSNEDEESLLRDAAYQSKICCVICGTFSDYLYNRIS